jgi:MFS family permease
MKLLDRQILAHLPQLNQKIWILIFGRFLSGIGTGFTLFYAPIFFASDELGLSKTAVGFALGSISVSGVIGRFLSGSMSDSPRWGRRRTLLLSTLVSSFASFILANTDGFYTLLFGNLIMGLGIGLYWPATEAVVADLSTGEQRHEAYAITRLGDSCGLGLGIILGGILVSLMGSYRLLFVVDAISFLVFSGVIYQAIPETYQFDRHQEQKLEKNGWLVALSDRILWIYCVVNIMFTTYISQVYTAMPLYFNEFVGSGLSTGLISALFTWHLVLSIILQLPIARFIRRFSHAKALIFSSILWAIGFILTGLTGVINYGQTSVALLANGVLAIATVAYLPSASALVADLAPPSVIGVYLSINSQCWAVGYFIGPVLAGWTLDQPRPWADLLWPGWAVTVLGAIAILQLLDRALKSNH